MRKLIFFLLLVALLFGVSYYKNLRDHEQEQTAYAQGLDEGRREIAGNTQTIDSIESLLEAERSRADSLTARQSNEDTSEQDSLNALIISREATIDRLRDLNDKLEAKLIDKTAETQEAKIVAYYNDRFQSLPADLSTYERKVAMSEIRTETAQKFKISSAELERIRKKYKLTD